MKRYLNDWWKMGSELLYRSWYLTVYPYRSSGRRMHIGSMGIVKSLTDAGSEAMSRMCRIHCFIASAKICCRTAFSKYRLLKRVGLSGYADSIDQ